MEPRISEQDEFLLSRLIDNDLPADEAAALRQRMADEPVFARAFDELARVNGLVADRRSDEPEIDWDRFHTRVMEQVRLEPKPRAATIKLSRWLTIGAPLAAAAAIALVVSVYSLRLDEPTRIDDDPGTLAAPTTFVHVTAPQAAPTTDDGAVRVRIARAEPSEQPVRVHFARSAAIADAVREADRTDEQVATSLVSVSTSPPTVSLPELAVLAVPALY